MLIKKILTASAFALLIASPAMAQTTTTDVAGHPRVNEVDQRLQDQQNRISTGTADGQIGSSKRAAADESRDAKIATETSKDEAADNGHLTKQNQRKINRQLNRNSTHIYTQRHNQ